MENSTSGPPILKKYLSVYKTNPRSRVFAPLAETYRKMGFQSKAMAILKDGIRHNPNYPMGYLGLSQCYFDQGQLELAYSTLRPLIGTNRDNIRMQKLFGKICMGLENYEEALDTYKYLLFINPKDFESQEKVKSLEETYLNNHLFFLDDTASKGESDIGKSELFKVENLSILPPGESDEWSTLDLTSSEVQKNKEPMEKEAWKMVNSSEVSENREVDPPKVAKIPEKENKEGPSSLETLTLVEVYISQGHKSKAREILNRILSKNPNDSLARQKLQELSQNSVSEGQKDLMDLYDKKLSAKKEKSIPEIKRRMTQFLDLIKDKALKKGHLK